MPEPVPTETPRGELRLRRQASWPHVRIARRILRDHWERRDRTALDLYTGEPRPARQDEVHLAVPVPPVVETDFRRARIEQMRADRTLDHMPPEAAVGPRLLERVSGKGRHQRRIEHVELGNRSPAAVRGACVIRKTGNQSRLREEVQIAGERRRVAGVLELADHLGVGEDLPRVQGAELEQPPEQRGLVHTLQREYVQLDVRLHDRVGHICAPAILLANHRSGAGVASEVDIARKVEVECSRHLRK